DVLTKAFDKEQDADELLDQIDFPKPRGPVFANARSVLAYWTGVCDEIDKGILTHGGLERLLVAAATLRPALAEALGEPARANGEPAKRAETASLEEQLSAREKYDREIEQQAKDLRLRLRELILAGAAPHEVEAVEAQLAELRRMRRHGPQL